MHALRTAVLEHTTDQGVHHDWLIQDPTLPDPNAPQARLWTARVLPPPWQWPELGRFELEVIPPHRRIYLDYQGPIANHRGRVTRVAQGQCVPRLWSRDRIVIDLRIYETAQMLDLRRLADARWLADTG